MQPECRAAVQQAPRRPKNRAAALPHGSAAAFFILWERREGSVFGSGCLFFAVFGELDKGRLAVVVPVLGGALG